MKKTTLSCMIFLVACLCSSNGQALISGTDPPFNNKQLTEQVHAQSQQLINFNVLFNNYDPGIAKKGEDVKSLQHDKEISDLRDQLGKEINRTKDLEKIVTEQKKELQELNSATNDLENTVTQQQKKNEEQRDTINDLEKEIKGPNYNTIEDLKDTVTQQQKEIEKQKDTTTQQQKEVEKQKDHNKDLENTVTQQQKELEKQKNNTKDLENIVTQQQKETEEQIKTNEIIRYIVTVQQTYLMKQIDATDVSTDKVTQQQKELEEQKDTVEDLEKKVKEQKTSTDDLKDTVKQQQKELEKQKDTSKDLENTDTQQQKNIQEIKDKMLRESYTCAFSYSTKPGDGDGVSNTIVKFTDKLIDIDSRYDSKTGIFTASKRGIYVFHLTIFCDETGLVNTGLWKNTESVAAVWAYDGFRRDQASISLALILEPGDKIYLKMAYTRNGKMLDYWRRYNMFSGYLLKLM